jgi:hypothetical protein
MKTKKRPPTNRLRSYFLYGLRLRSVWPLPAPESPARGCAEVVMAQAPARLFEAARREARALPRGDDWWVHARRADGSDYLLWDGLFEFLVSPDGRRIVGRPMSRFSPAVFFSYLLGQVLSFSLLKLGLEPMHATVIVIDGRAVSLTGFSGHGKSVLAAAFLKAGHSLLTDDLLTLRPAGPGFAAYPGLPRVKLYSRDARRIFGRGIKGFRAAALTPKWIVRLGGDLSSGRTAPLGAFYVLRPPSRSLKKTTIRRLPPRRAFVEILRGTFNKRVTEPERLKRQFETAFRLASSVPVMALSYPQGFTRLGGVVEAVRADLKKRTTGRKEKP